MAQKDFENIAILKNDKGEIIDILEIKTLPTTEIKTMRKQATEKKKEIATEKSKALDKENKRKENETKALSNVKYVVAYLMFNELVERGEIETTNEFETMYSGWLVGNNELDLKIAPIGFLTILERIK